MRIDKVDSRGISGIFLGYELANGHKWEGRYLVAPLVDFEKGYNTKSEKIRVQITDQIINWNPAQLVYPCKESREKARVTVDKLVGDNSKIADEEDDAQEDAPGGSQQQCSLISMT